MPGRLLRRKGASIWLAAVALPICFSLQAAYPAGEGVRVANSTLRFPSEPPVVGFGVTNILGDLTFDDPVCVKFPPGATNRLFVVERIGRIMVITNLAAPSKTI